MVNYNMGGSIQDRTTLKADQIQTAAAATIQYPFVDWIRMISMIGIVWAHIPNFKGSENFVYLDNLPGYLFFMDFFKFGVICFFLISGFLLAQQIDSKPPIQYLKRRLSTTLRPYLFAFGLIVLLFIVKTKVLHVFSSNTILQYIQTMFFVSALWFLPNYLISLTIIISLKRFLKSPVLGLIFLLITLIYTYFLVYSAYSRSHVYALFAYMFYLWLGYYIAKLNLQEYFKRLNIYILLSICAVLYICASSESVMLFNLNSKEPMNILRFSNQLYSVAAFILMVRLFQKPISDKFVNPRKETYGIYLYHMFPIAFLTFFLNKLGPVAFQTFDNHLAGFIVWFIIKFMIVYALTILLVKFLRKYRLAFIN